MSSTSEEPPENREGRVLDYGRPEPRRRRWLVLCLAVAASAALLAGAWMARVRPGGGANVGGPSNRVPCASQMRQIGQGILLYAMDHGGQYPDSLEKLIVDEGLGAEVFVCPQGDDRKATGATTQQVAANAMTPGHLSFVYLGSGMTTQTVSPDTVVMYELAANHEAGANVLFGDGHVTFHSIAEMTALLGGAPATQPKGK